MLRRGWTLVAVLSVGVLAALACGGADLAQAPPAGGGAPALASTEAASAVRALPPLVEHSEPRPDDCLLEVGTLGLRFAASQPGGAQVAVTRDEGQVVEEFTLDDGTPVRALQGGCSHVGIIETYVLAAPPKDLLAETRAVAGRVVRADTDDDPLLEGLRKVASLPEDGALQCGDAYCSLTADGPVVTLSYTFAL